MTGLTLIVLALPALVIAYACLKPRRPARRRGIPLGSVSDAVRSRFLAAVLAVGLLGATTGQISCAGSVVSRPALSPAGETAYQARRVVQALDVLRDAATDAEAQTPKLISTANTRKIVDFHESAVKTIGAVPGGWRPTVSAGLTQLQADLPPADWSRIAPYVTLVKALIEGIQ
jgi:hypothetical protein